MPLSAKQQKCSATSTSSRLTTPQHFYTFFGWKRHSSNWGKSALIFMREVGFGAE